MKAAWVIAVCLATAPAWTSAARADGPPRRGERPAHWAIGVGGFSSLEGLADFGPAAEVELYPGGRFGRWGARAAFLGLGNDVDGAIVTAGLTYTAGAARPHLHLGLHGELAATVDEPGGARVGAGGGLQAQLWLKGPLALGLDSTVHVLYRDGDLAIHLASAFTLRISL